MDDPCNSSSGSEGSRSGNEGGINTTGEKTNINFKINLSSDRAGHGGGGGFVDTSKADRAVWLMKCPPVVSKFFQPSESFSSPPSPPSDPSRPVAKVVLSIDPLRSQDDDSSPQFKMELPGTESGNLPKCYSMDMSKDFIPLCSFSESSRGRISVEGKILNKFDMKLQNEDIESYGKTCRERANKFLNGRKIQVIGNDYRTHLRSMPGMVGSSPGFNDKRKVVTKGTELKRTRKDRGVMEDNMFKLFETQQNWTLRQLIQKTDQPEQFLKDILRDLCIYNNKGANQGTYELKPEYRKSGDEPENPA